MPAEVALKRRIFLAALGLGVGVPLASRVARFAGAQPTAAPVRLLNIFIPHGIPWEHADPADPGGGLALVANGVGVLGPLQPYQAYVNVVRGIAMADGATNHGAIRTALTGSLAANNDSVDYVIAQALGVSAHALGAIPYKETEGFGPDSQLIRHGGTWVRAIESPAAAADELFRSLASSEPAVDESVFFQEAMALTEKQLNTLRNELSGLTREQDKLSVHLEAIQQLKSNSGTGIVACSERPNLPGLAATAGINPLDETKLGLVLDAQLEVAAQAMLCGTARVLTLQALWVNSNTRFDFEGGPGIPIEHHIGLSHGGRPRDSYALAQKWFFERIAEKLLSVLNQPDPADPGRSVLDNSVIYITSEVSDGGNHNSDAGEAYVHGQPMYTFLPQILLGGAGGYLKAGGNLIQVEQNRPHTDVLATIAQAMGAPLPQVGSQPANVIAELRA